MIGPDATGAGWVYEYLLIDRGHNLNLADLRSLQDWHIRYALETVPGVAEVATIGGFVRQYQVKLDPNRLLALGVFRCRRSSTRSATATARSAGAVLEMTGADYLVREPRLYPFTADHRADCGGYQQRHAGADPRSGRG